MEARKEREKAQDEHGQEKIDLFSKFLAAKDPVTGEGLSHNQLWAESNLVIIAGSDTSSTGLAATFFYLSRSPSAYTRVTQEVRAVFPSPDAVCQGPKLLSCIYLHACIQEAMRLVPSAGGATWREALPGGLQVPNAGTDLYIPAGCEVGRGIWSLDHNETYYPEPFAFRPERWIAAEVGDEAVARARAAYATFLFGPRNCVGKSLTMSEICLAMAAIISGYDFRRPETKLGDVGEETGAFKGQYKIFWAFTSFKDGPYIQFT